MGKIEFSPDQQTVIDARDCNLLVSAAAGSGKTAVLVERIIQLICDEKNPIDIDQLLVVTFTNAAAAQMREKIARAIEDKLALHPEDEHLERQAVLVHNAQITTIDSFCMFVIRNNFNDIGLDPGFRIGDDGEMKLLFSETLEQVLEDKYSEQDEAFLAMVDSICMDSDDKTIEQIVERVYHVAMSYPWPKLWLKKHSEDYQITGVLEEAEWYPLLLQQIVESGKGILQKAQMGRKLCEEPDGPYMYGQILEKDEELLETFLASVSCGIADKNVCDTVCKIAGNSDDKIEENIDFQTVVTKFEALNQAIKSVRLPGKKDDSVNPQKRELVKNIRANMKGLLANMEADYFVFPKEQVLEHMKICDANLHAICELTKDFMDAFAFAKRERNILDFNDIEHMALEILARPTEAGVEPTETALEYQDHYAYIMIDEYQDSNLVQEYLLSSISRDQRGEYNRFMVGDVKQSIYKFRMARPEIFLEKYQEYKSVQNTKKELRAIDLHQNFRSRSQVLDTTNAVFRQLMGKQLGGIEYDDNAALYLGAKYPDGDCFQSELLLYTAGEEETELNAKELEAYGVGLRLIDYCQKGYVTDEKTGLLRRPKFGDIVILLRSLHGFEDIFVKQFEKLGIPVYISSKSGYFGTYEIRTLLHFLRIIDNPLQDIPFFGILHSYFGKFSDEEVAYIRSRKDAKKKYLYENCKELLGELEEKAELNVFEKELLCKLNGFMKQLKEYRELAGFLPIHELLRKVLADTEYRIYVSVMPGGEKRLANVDMLMAKALDFEKTSYFGLYHFIRYMEQLEKYDVDYGEANTLGEDSNAVQIMSIHKSKGLEFPVCFVSGLGKSFNRMDVFSNVIIDSDLGIGMKMQDAKRRTVASTLRRNVLKEKIMQDDMAEELRVLYVAMTRAKEKMILTGSMKKVEERLLEYQLTGQEKKSEDVIEKAYLLQVNSMLEWVAMAAEAGDMPVEKKLVSYDELKQLEVLNEVKRELSKDVLMDALLPKEVLPQREELGGETKETELVKKIRSGLKRSYGHANLQGLHTKVSVSELKKAAMEEQDEESFQLFHSLEQEPIVPRFVEEKKEAGGTFRGNAYHRYMELLDFKSLYKFYDESGLALLFEELVGKWGSYDVENQTDSSNQINRNRYEKILDVEDAIEKKVYHFLYLQKDRMVESEKLSEEYANVLNMKKMLHFVLNPVAYDMAKASLADCLYREQPFVLGLPASRMNEEFPEEEMVLIQGIVDAFWKEKDQYVILDYKTDRVTEAEDLVKRYEAQLGYYQEALNQMKRPVERKLIYSFALEQVIEV